LERANDFNRSYSSRIYFIDEQDMPQLRQLNLFRLTKRNPQYLFSPQALASLAGSRFQNLRRKISLASRRMEIQIQPYGPEYAAQCRQLLNDWEKRKEKQSDSLFLQRRYALQRFSFCSPTGQPGLEGLCLSCRGTGPRIDLWG
jgi:hypothetical protein